MNREKLERLVDALNNGDINSDDYKELMDYYNSFQVADKWDEKNMGNMSIVEKSIFNKIIQKRQQPNKVKTIYKIFKWAAACILLFSLCYTGYYFMPSSNVIIVNTTKNQKEVLLPDGTQVVLNVNSEISYPKSFGDGRRVVKFSGEGYFDVAKDSIHPFIIETDYIKVRVLGTIFNFKAYHDDPKIETSLIEGAVALISKDEQTVYSVLKPNQKFTAEKDVLLKPNRELTTKKELLVEKLEYTGLTKKSPVDIVWKEGKIGFSSATLNEIATTLKRKYDVNLKIVNPEKMEYKYTAVFDGESVEDILRSLSIVKHFDYRKEGNDIIIY